MRCFVLSLLVLFSLRLSSQSDLALLQQKSQVRMEETKQSLRDNRKFTRSYNPLKIVGNSLLWVYQKVFSEQVNAGCGFDPSCSSFAKEAVNQRGLIVGILLAADRLTRCNGAQQLESEVYLVDKKTGKLHDDPGMYRLRR